MKKQDPTICCLQRSHFKYKDTNMSKLKGWKKIYHAGKKRMTMLISDKVQFRTQNVTKNKDHLIMIKE